MSVSEDFNDLCVELCHTAKERYAEGEGMTKYERADSPVFMAIDATYHTLLHNYNREVSSWKKNMGAGHLLAQVDAYLFARHLRVFVNHRHRR